MNHYCHCFVVVVVNVTEAKHRASLYACVSTCISSLNDARPVHHINTPQQHHFSFVTDRPTTLKYPLLDLNYTLTFIELYKRPSKVHPLRAHWLLLTQLPLASFQEQLTQRTVLVSVRYSIITIHSNIKIGILSTLSKHQYSYTDHFQITGIIFNRVIDFFLNNCLF